MKLKHVLAVAGLAVALSQSVSAVTLNSVYTGATPESTLSYEFNDVTKILSMSMSGPSATEFVGTWGFDITGNTTGWAVDSVIGNVADPELNTPAALGALNPISFDIAFGFKNGAGSDRFQAGDTINILLPNVTSILTSGAHVRGIAAAPGSGKVTVGVPEPGSILAGLTAIGMFALGRKRLA
jgi:hypothetical protein